MGPDLLYAATLPAFSEAIGIASSMSKTGLPYVLSFVVRPTGTLLDGSTLANAMEQIDNQIYPPPTGYAVNCVHPRIFLEALKNLAAQNEAMLSRILSFQANAADLTPEALDNQENLLGDEPSELADLMKQVHEAYHVPFLGGCCGTDERLITALADLITLRRNGTQPEE